MRNPVVKNMHKFNQNKVEGKHEYRYKKRQEQRRTDAIEERDQIDEFLGRGRRDNNQTERPPIHPREQAGNGPAKDSK